MGVQQGPPGLANTRVTQPVVGLVAEDGHAVTGVDFSTQMLAEARGKRSTGGGLEADEVTDALARVGRSATATPLGDERLWGRYIEDDRYLILS